MAIAKAKMAAAATIECPAESLASSTIPGAASLPG
jgi:hypothetical protein